MYVEKLRRYMFSHRVTQAIHICHKMNRLKIDIFFFSLYMNAHEMKHIHFLFFSLLRASICEWIQLRNMLIGNHIDEQIHPYLETRSHWRRHRGNALRNEQKNSNDISILECWFYAWILMTNSPMVHHNNSIRWGQRHSRLLPFIPHCKWWRKNRKVKISVNFFVFLKTRLQTHSMKHLN